MNFESKVAAAAAAVGIFVPTIKWLLALVGVAIDDLAALGLAVLLALLGGALWTSKTSVVSSGFSPLAIPRDAELRQNIKAEVTSHPDGPSPVRDKRHELGHGSAPYVVWVLVGVILLIVLLRLLGVL